MQWSIYSDNIFDDTRMPLKSKACNITMYFEILVRI